MTPLSVLKNYSAIEDRNSIQIEQAGRESMRILINGFILLALVILCPVIGILIALALAGSLLLFPVALVILVETMILKTQRIFVRACGAVFHGHGIRRYHSPA